MYRLIIRRDARTPHCYRVTDSYPVIEPQMPAVCNWFKRGLFMLSPTPKRPGTICNPRKILAEYQAAKMGNNG